MANQVYQSQKVELQFSKKDIDKAARTIRHGCLGDERTEAISKIQNFRAIHLYPLMLIKNHIARTSSKVSKNVIIARRLKRLPTIIDKLERPTLDGETENAIKLTRMQDIGGCRAIVKNITQLKALKKKLEDSKSVHKIINTHDYLQPKRSGYGGVHLIYSCFHDDTSNNQWKRTKIEVQLRTNLQHAWATSLEIIDTLERIKLKTRLDGHSQWRRFFYIAGVLVANDEGAIKLDEEELLELETELTDLQKDLGVLSKLLKFSLAINAVTNHREKKHNTSQGMCLVILQQDDLSETDVELKMILRVAKFDLKDSKKAIEAYNESEKDGNIIISALVSTSDVKNLKKAYPNYFGSTTDFAEFINKHLH